MKSIIFRNSKLLYKIKSSSKFCTANTNKKLLLNQILEKWKSKFQSAQIEDSEFTLKCLLAHTLNQNFTSLPEIDILKITDDQLQKLEKLCECRLARIPLQYIIGEWDFRNLILKMLPSVFIPRPETEKLIDLVIKDLDISQKLEFLEIGSGTGAISLSILDVHKNSTAVALDRSKMACTLTMENAQSLGLDNRIKVYNYTIKENGNLPDELSGQKFNVIVSNPPYIKTSLISSLEPEIKLYENLNALDGGEDGLKVAKILLELAKNSLLLGGKLWIELDSSHPPLIEKIVENKYSKILKYVTSHNDVYGKQRFVEIVKIS